MRYGCTVLAFPSGGRCRACEADEVSRGKVTLIAQHLIRQPYGCHLPPLGKAWLPAFRLFCAPNTVCGNRLNGRTQFAPTDAWVSPPQKPPDIKRCRAVAVLCHKLSYGICFKLFGKRSQRSSPRCFLLPECGSGVSGDYSYIPGDVVELS